MHKVKFDLDAASMGKITLDGNPIDVTELTYHAKAGDIAELTLKIVAQVEGDIAVTALTSGREVKKRSEDMVKIRVEQGVNADEFIRTPVR